MIFRMGSRGLLVAAIGLVAFAASAGIAKAEPEPDIAPPPAPPIEQLLTQTLLTQSPSLFSNPADRGRPSEANWGGVGMYCQNLYVKCR